MVTSSFGSKRMRWQRVPSSRCSARWWCASSCSLPRPFLSTLKSFNVNTCSASTERPQHGGYRTIKYYPNYCWGNGTNGNIGCVDSITIASAFLDNTRQPREVHWYAKNLGWVRYEEYDAAGNRTKDIYWTTMSSTSYPVSDVCQ